jgi:hypothetical protein
VAGSSIHTGCIDKKPFECPCTEVQHNSKGFAIMTLLSCVLMFHVKKHLNQSCAAAAVATPANNTAGKNAQTQTKENRQARQCTRRTVLTAAAATLRPMQSLSP